MMHITTHIHSLVTTLSKQMLNQPMAAAQCIYPCRHSQDDLLKFTKLSIRIRVKGDLSDYECGIAVGAGQAGPSISETAG